MLTRDHPSVLETKGLLMLRRGQADRAKGLLEEARNKGRDTATLHGALGDTYLSLKLWQNAVPAYKQALRHDMRDINWRRSLGIALARSGRPAEAENAFREVLAIHSGDVAAWTELEKLNER
jgi:predicted Zn-dependent protease